MITTTPDLSAPVLTLDGPSGVGKGTTALLLAEHLAWQVLDSGAIYRLLAYAAKAQHIRLDDEAALAALIPKLSVRFVPLFDQHTVAVYWAGEDISAQVRSRNTGEWASQVAVWPQVRHALLAWQRQFQQQPGLIADGRDMGTMVFPCAKVKIFLTAQPEERAKRRYKQLKEKGIDANMPAILQELNLRDARDQNRQVAPLLPAEDALVIDTSNLSVSDVVSVILAHKKNKRI